MKSTVKVVRPLRNGQITIPAAFRRRLGIDEETLLRMELSGSELRIRPVRINADAGSDWFQNLYELFGEARKEASTRKGSEIDRDIATAVRRARKSHGSGRS